MEIKVAMMIRRLSKDEVSKDSNSRNPTRLGQAAYRWANQMSSLVDHHDLPST